MPKSLPFRPLAALAALLLLAGLALRMHTAPEALAGDRVRLYEADPYLHLRRAVQLWQGAPGLGYTDPFQNFPDAQTCSQLPVGFAGLMSLAGHLVPGPNPQERIALGGGVIAVPLLGTLAALLAWLLTRRRDPVFGLLTLGTMALLPIAVDASMSGRMDHHVLDPLLVAGMLLALVKNLPILAGLLGFMALASFPSALVTVTVTLAAAPVAALLTAWTGGQAQTLARAGMLAGAVSGGLGLLFLLVATPCANSSALLANTWLPPLLSLAVALVSLLVRLLLPDTLPNRRPRVLLLLALGLLLPILLLLLVPQAHAWLSVLQGQFAGRLTSEWAPLWQTSASWWSGKLSWAFVLIPFGWLVLLRQALRADAQPVTRILAAHVWLVAPAFVLQAKYFSHLAALALCMGLAASIEPLRDLLRPAPERTRGLAVGLGAVVVLTLGIEPASNYRAKTLVWQSTTAVTEVLDWMQHNTPPVNPQQPEYGVLSLWSNGFWIAALGERPTYTNNFVAAPENSVYVQHILDSFAWLFAAQPDALYAGMTQKKLKYLLTTPADAHELRAFQQTTSKPIPDLLSADGMQPGIAFQHSVLVHLVALYGTATHDAQCLDQLQLVAGSKFLLDMGGRHTPAVQLYQRVPGARVTLHRLVPGTPIRLGTARKLGEQTFVYECHGHADKDGNAELRFPYPDTPTGQVQPASPILLWTGVAKDPDRLEIQAQDVEQGREVKAPL